MNIEPSKADSSLERAWKYVKKPLLRIGAQGISRSHGNSLRELLMAHTLVKVKINSVTLGSMQQVFDTLKDEAEMSGAAKEMELIMSRESAKIILIGLAGSLERIQKGEFPPVL
jgi:RNA-binding protein YhbY